MAHQFERFSVTGLSLIWRGGFAIALAVCTCSVAGCFDKTDDQDRADAASERVCEPGRTQSCPCSGDLERSTQRCKTDGSGWKPCRCTTPADGDSGANDAQDSTAVDAMDVAVQDSSDVEGPDSDSTDLDTGDTSAEDTDDTEDTDGDVVDSTLQCEQVWYRDGDDDGFGTSEDTVRSCDDASPAGYVDNSKDCDDSNPNIRPGATELCDGIDNNCDGRVDGWRVGCPQIEIVGTGARDDAFSARVGSDGDLYVTGFSEGDLFGKTNSGGYDGFLAKFSSTTNREWARLIGTAAFDSAKSSTEGPSANSYVVGYTKGELSGRTNRGGQDLYVRKFGPGGTKKWTQMFGTAADERGFDISFAESSSKIWVTGVSEGDLGTNSNSGGRDAFLISYGLNGQRKDVELFGTNGDDWATDVATHGSSAVYVAGRTEGNLGDKSNAGQFDGFVAKFDGAGKNQWVKLFGTANSDFVTDVAVGNSGDIYITGNVEGALPGKSHAGGNDGFVAKLDSSGNTLWLRQFGSGADDSPTGLAISNNGDVYVTGGTDGGPFGTQNQGGDDAFLTKFSPSGSRQWFSLAGSNEAEVGYDVVIKSGRPIVVGYTQGALGGINHIGKNDIFLAK